MMSDCEFYSGEGDPTFVIGLNECSSDEELKSRYRRTESDARFMAVSSNYSGSFDIQNSDDDLFECGSENENNGTLFTYEDRELADDNKKASTTLNGPKASGASKKGRKSSGMENVINNIDMKKRKISNISVRKSPDGSVPAWRDIAWHLRYFLMLRFGKIHGHCNVPISCAISLDSTFPSPSVSSSSQIANEFYEHLRNSGHPNELTSKGRDEGMIALTCWFDTMNVVRLGTWLGTQRADYKNNTLRADRRALMEELVRVGLFKWQVKVIEPDAWDAMYERLVSVCTKIGHANIPFNFIYSDSVVSAPETDALVQSDAQIVVQAAAKVAEVVAGNPDSFALPTVEEVTGDIQDIATVAEPTELVIANDRVNAGASFFGATPVAPPGITNPISLKLGQWLATQRQSHKKGEMALYRWEKLQKLVDAGLLEWEVKKLSNDAMWEQNYQALLRYFSIHGHCNPPSWYVEVLNGSEHGLRVGKWLDRQRQAYKSNTLRADRQVSLQALCDQKVLRWAKKDSEKRGPSRQPGEREVRVKKFHGLCESCSASLRA